MLLSFFHSFIHCGRCSFSLVNTKYTNTSGYYLTRFLGNMLMLTTITPSQTPWLLNPCCTKDIFFLVHIICAIFDVSNPFSVPYSIPRRDPDQDKAITESQGVNYAFSVCLSFWIHIYSMDEIHTFFTGCPKSPEASRGIIPYMKFKRKSSLHVTTLVLNVQRSCIFIIYTSVVKSKVISLSTMGLGFWDTLEMFYINNWKMCIKFSKYIGAFKRAEMPILKLTEKKSRWSPVWSLWGSKKNKQTPRQSTCTRTIYHYIKLGSIASINLSSRIGESLENWHALWWCFSSTTSRVVMYHVITTVGSKSQRKFMKITVSFFFNFYYKWCHQQ